MVEPVVLHEPATDVAAFAGDPGDRSRADVRLQSSGRGEPAPVVADLPQNAGTDLGTDPRKARHDRRVRVRPKGLLSGPRQFIDFVKQVLTEEECGETVADVLRQMEAVSVGHAFDAHPAPAGAQSVRLSIV
ncbi:hypothetical protein GA0115254_123813 [Streptomyces sp. Ncost-T10-10d]|nr:hypothetical protein GA0115254_123813 [Streptomyces sp. Ncost-T10-10d]